MFVFFTLVLAVTGLSVGLLLSICIPLEVKAHNLGTVAFFPSESFVKGAVRFLAANRLNANIAAKGVSKTILISDPSLQDDCLVQGSHEVEILRSKIRDTEHGCPAVVRLNITDLRKVHVLSGTYSIPLRYSFPTNPQITTHIPTASLAIINNKNIPKKIVWPFISHSKFAFGEMGFFEFLPTSVCGFLRGIGALFQRMELQTVDNSLRERCNRKREREYNQSNVEIVPIADKNYKLLGFSEEFSNADDEFKWRWLTLGIAGFVCFICGLVICHTKSLFIGMLLYLIGWVCGVIGFICWLK
jgi:hypothetical protein